MQLKKMNPVKYPALLVVSVFIFMALLFTDCNSPLNPPKGDLKNDPSKGVSRELPADFVAFYEKFHQDSAYQMAHIIFPLEGYPSQVDSATIAEGTFRWYADTWRMHKMAGFTSTDFTRTFEEKLPGMMNETVLQNGSPYGMFRRFYKRGDEWFLIFYSDMNPMKE